MAAQNFVNVSATPPAFPLSGGQYGLVAQATTWGTAQLQLLSGDGVTWMNIGTALSANGQSVVTLPPGQYQLLLTGLSGGYISVRPIAPAT